MNKPILARRTVVGPRKQSTSAGASLVFAPAFLISFAFALVASVVLPGCSARTSEPPPSSEQDVTTAECTSLGEALARCFAIEGVPVAEANARSAQTRDAMLARLQREPSSALAIGAQCKANRELVQTQCQ